MKFNVFAIGLAATVALAGTASAGKYLPPASDATTSTTKGFIGLNWTFGSKASGPEAVIGVAHGNVDSSGEMKGAKAAVHFYLSNDFAPGKVKLTGLFGNTDAQAEIGLGYHLGDLSWFGVVGVNTNYLSGGADFGSSGQLDGYIGIHSIGEFDTPVKVTTLPPT